MSSINDDSKHSDPSGETRIDLGEDLLAEPTSNSSANEAQSTVESGDDLQKGEILMGERLFEDAKQIFRKILRKDPENEKAKQALLEIQRQEIKDLLNVEGAPQRLSRLQDQVADTPAAILEKLDEELHLGIEKADFELIPDLFKSEQEYISYRERTFKLAIGLDPKDRIDIGIAHFEMGLYEVANLIFQSVVRYEALRLAGTYLLGLSLIYGGKAIEATIRLEPVVRDMSLTESQKTDFLYLMGMAFEALKESRRAREFYRRVHLLNPKYRDVAEKLNK